MEAHQVILLHQSESGGEAVGEGRGLVASFVTTLKADVVHALREAEPEGDGVSGIDGDARGDRGGD